MECPSTPMSRITKVNSSTTASTEHTRAWTHSYQVPARRLSGFFFSPVCLSSCSPASRLCLSLRFMLKQPDPAPRPARRCPPSRPAAPETPPGPASQRLSTGPRCGSAAVLAVVAVVAHDKDRQPSGTVQGELQSPPPDPGGLPDIGLLQQAAPST